MNKNAKKPWQLLTLLALDFALLILIAAFSAERAAAFCLGCNGENIGEIQQILKDKSLYSGEISGEYNLETRHAIKKFQNRFFGDGNGETDYRTLSALGINSRTSPCFNSEIQLLARCISVSNCKNYPEMVEKGIEIIKISNDFHSLSKYISLKNSDVLTEDFEPNSLAYSAALTASILSG